MPPNRSAIGPASCPHCRWAGRGPARAPAERLAPASPAPVALRDAVPEAEQFRHEGVYPVIIQREDWDQAQELLKQNARNPPAPGNKAKHRYAGLLACADCGNPFVPMIRYWNGNRRVEYVCKGYHRNGKTYCSSHRIHEETLDARVWELVSTARESRAEELKKLAQMQKMWALRKPILDAHILSLREKAQKLEQEVDWIVMEKVLKQK